MNRIRKHIIFHGDVQGVGFRWAAQSIAESCRVSGWVRNLYDGSVEMEAEGTPQDIAAVIQRLRDYRHCRVEWVDEKDIPPEGGYAFEIR